MDHSFALDSISFVRRLNGESVATLLLEPTGRSYEVEHLDISSSLCRFICVEGSCSIIIKERRWYTWQTVYRTCLAPDNCIQLFSRRERGIFPVDHRVTIIALSALVRVEFDFTSSCWMRA
jgi:hypothetical protein